MSFRSFQAEVLSLRIQLVHSQQWAPMSTKHSHNKFSYGHSSWFTSQSLFRNELSRLMKSLEHMVFTDRLCPACRDILPRIRENTSELCWKPQQTDQEDWLTSPLPLKQQSCDRNRKPNCCWLVIAIKILQQDSKTSLQQHLAVNHKASTKGINLYHLK